VTAYGWQSIFLLNLPFGLLALGVIAVTLPSSGRTRRGSIDWLGASVLGAASALLLTALVWGGASYPWLSVRVLGAFVGSGVLAGLFVVVERRTSEKILPFRLLRDRAVVASLACLGFSGAVQLGCVAYIPLFLQGVLGETSVSAGAALLPFLGALAVASVLSGQVIARTGKLRPSALAGPLFTVAGLVLLARLGTGSSVGDVARSTVLIGFGVGLINQVFLLTVQNSVKRQALSSATALIQFSKLMGGTLGITVVGVIINQRLSGHADLTGGAIGSPMFGVTRSTLAHALSAGFILMAAVEAVILLLVYRWIRNTPLRSHAESAVEGLAP
jgi:predicted MFS family arabinose efflux permease